MKECFFIILMLLNVTFLSPSSPPLEGTHIHFGSKADCSGAISDHIPLNSYDSLKEYIDYSYHFKYSPERQLIHNAIIASYLGTTAFSDHSNANWIIFTAGTMGSGKSFTLKWLAEQHLFPLDHFLLIDFDIIRLFLPETFQNNTIMISPSLQKEVGYLVEIITFGALKLGLNVLVDGSLKDHQWYANYFARLKNIFPSLKLAIFHITSPLELVLRRVDSRAHITGRYLIFDHVIRTYEEIPKTIEILSPLVDYYCTIWNDGEPILISSSFDIKDDSMFQTFRQFWIHEVVDKT